MAVTSSVTAGRATVLRLDVTERTMTRPAYSISRYGAQIRPQNNRRAQNDPFYLFNDMTLVGGEGWIMTPIPREMGQALKLDSATESIGSADVELAPGIEAVKQYRASTDLPQVGTGSVISTITGYQKRVQAGTKWDTAVLTADALAMPAPTALTTQVVPLDRQIKGKKTYPANTPWFLSGHVPNGAEGRDAIARFYFGGNAPVLPVEETGGFFCVELRGGGGATLYEYDEGATDPWVPRFEFEWNQSAKEVSGSGSIWHIHIVPYDRDRIAFICPAPGGYYGPGFTLGGLLTQIAMSATSTFARPVSQQVFKDYGERNTHQHLDTATGEGSFRVDRRRDDRMPMSIWKGGFRETAKLIDAPFVIPFDVPAGTPMTVTTRAFRAVNTGGPSPAIYDYDTNTVLATNAAGQFLSVAGQTKYYCRFGFSSTGDQTPVFYGYEVEVAAAYATRVATPTLSYLNSVDIQGPDVSPDHESASVTIQDPNATLGILRTRDRIHSYISVVNAAATATVLSNLFEGETLQAKGKKRGVPGGVYPVSNWYEFNVPLTGMWTRLAEQFSLQLKSFHIDPDGAVDATGTPIPWKVTAVIKWLLQQAGVPDDELDIPDLPLRLWPSTKLGQDDYLHQPGQPFDKMAVSLAKDMLGRVLLRDPNASKSAGVRGLWRLIANPSPPYTNTLWSFLRDTGAAAGVLQHDLTGYPASTGFIRKGSYYEYVKAPEGNLVVAAGVSPMSAGGELLISRIVNYDSITNSAHPDFLGRIVPILRGPDPGLTTQNAVDWVARRIYDKACHAEKWWEFEAPLVLVTDPLDSLQVLPRPLRINDLCLVNGVVSVVKNCSPSYGMELRDHNQMARYEGLYLA